MRILISAANWLRRQIPANSFKLHIYAGFQWKDIEIDECKDNQEKDNFEFLSRFIFFSEARKNFVRFACRILLSGLNADYDD